MQLFVYRLELNTWGKLTVLAVFAVFLQRSAERAGKTSVSPFIKALQWYKVGKTLLSIKLLYIWCWDCWTSSLSVFLFSLKAHLSTPCGIPSCLLNLDTVLSVKLQSPHMILRQKCNHDVFHWRKLQKSSFL